MTFSVDWMQRYLATLDGPEREAAQTLCDQVLALARTAKPDGWNPADPTSEIPYVELHLHKPGSFAPLKEALLELVRRYETTPNPDPVEVPDTAIPSEVKTTAKIDVSTLSSFGSAIHGILRAAIDGASDEGGTGLEIRILRTTLVPVTRWLSDPAIGAEEKEHMLGLVLALATEAERSYNHALLIPYQPGQMPYLLAEALQSFRSSEGMRSSLRITRVTMQKAQGRVASPKNDLGALANSIRGVLSDELGMSLSFQPDAAVAANAIRGRFRHNLQNVLAFADLAQLYGQCATAFAQVEATFTPRQADQLLEFAALKSQQIVPHLEKLIREGRVVARFQREGSSGGTRAREGHAATEGAESAVGTRSRPGLPHSEIEKCLSIIQQLNEMAPAAPAMASRTDRLVAPEIVGIGVDAERLDPKPFQLGIRDALIGGLRRYDDVYAVAAPGSGKSLIIALTADHYRSLGHPVIVIAGNMAYERDVLANTFRRQGINFEQPSVAQLARQLTKPGAIQLVTIQALHSAVQTLSESYSGSPNTDERRLICVVDEAHVVPTLEWGQSYKRLHAKAAALTATPFRPDGEGLEDYFGTWVAEYAEVDSLADSRTLAVPLFVPAGDDTEFAGYESKLSTPLYSRVLKLARYIDQTDSARAENDVGQWVVYCSRIDEANAVAEALRSRYGDRVYLVTSRPPETAEAQDARLRDPLAIQVNVAMLQTGVDMPMAAFGCNIGNGESATRLIQEVGRLSRVFNHPVLSKPGPWFVDLSSSARALKVPTLRQNNPPPGPGGGGSDSGGSGGSTSRPPDIRDVAPSRGMWRLSARELAALHFVTFPTVVQAAVELGDKLTRDNVLQYCNGYILPSKRIVDSMFGSPRLFVQFVQGIRIRRASELVAETDASQYAPSREVLHETNLAFGGLHTLMEYRNTLNSRLQKASLSLPFIRYLVANTQRTDKTPEEMAAAFCHNYNPWIKATDHEPEDSRRIGRRLVEEAEGGMDQLITITSPAELKQATMAIEVSEPQTFVAFQSRVRSSPLSLFDLARFTGVDPISVADTFADLGGWEAVRYVVRGCSHRDWQSSFDRRVVHLSDLGVRVAEVVAGKADRPLTPGTVTKEFIAADPTEELVMATVLGRDGLSTG